MNTNPMQPNSPSVPDTPIIPQGTPLRKRRCKACGESFYTREQGRTECQNCVGDYNNEDQQDREAAIIERTTAAPRTETPQVTETPALPAKLARPKPSKAK